jgi:hypothetical protein
MQLAKNEAVSSNKDEASMEMAMKRLCSKFKDRT